MTKTVTRRQNYYKPRFWPIWLMISILWLLIKLPYAYQLAIGRLFGRLMWRFATKMRAITEVNLQRCFPELTLSERQKLLEKSFASAGIGIMETALAFWAPDEKLRHLVDIQGLQYIHTALARGKGVLLIGTHFSTLQLIGRLMAIHQPFVVVYRKQKNPLFNFLTQRMVHKYYQQALPRGDLRGILDCLAHNIPVWFTPDIDAGLRNSVFVPFFGIPAASITATARLAKLSGAAVIMSGYYRCDDGTGYTIEILPALVNFPTDDIVQDTLTINQLQEAAIRKKPEQYLWQYKRFKTRPPGEARFY